MGIQIGNEILYTLLFADDQVLIAGDEEDASYMLGKLKEEYVKWGLEINFQKTEYLALGETGNDLSLDNNSIRNTNQLKYLGVTLGKAGKCDLDITNKTNQGRRVIGQLNSVMWSKEISKKNKTTIYL